MSPLKIFCLLHSSTKYGFDKHILTPYARERILLLGFHMYTARRSAIIDPNSIWSDSIQKESVFKSTLQYVSQ